MCCPACKEHLSNYRLTAKFRTHAHGRESAALKCYHCGFEFKRFIYRQKDGGICITLVSGYLDELEESLEELPEKDNIVPFKPKK